MAPTASLPPTEKQWLAAEPRHVLTSVQGIGQKRRLRLFAVARCRQVAHLLPDREWCRRAIEVAEAHAESLATREDLHRAHRENERVIRSLGYLAILIRPAEYPHNAYGTAHALRSVHFVTGQDFFCDFSFLVHSLCDAAGWTFKDEAERTKARGQPGSCPRVDDPILKATLRDIIPNPFRQTSTPAFSASVRSMALAAYDERRWPGGTLDPARLSILGDALEDAGRAHGEILDHLRSPGPHYRGCWALDLVLGKK